MHYLTAILLLLLMCGCIEGTDRTTPTTTAKPTQETTTTLGETQTTVEATTQPMPPSTEEECNRLLEKISSMLDEAKKCSVDEDCIVLEAQFGCPFGCHNLANKNANLTGIKENVEEYRKKCALCEYECPQPPRHEEIRCRSNKCVQETFAIKAKP